MVDIEPKLAYIVTIITGLDWDMVIGVHESERTVLYRLNWFQVLGACEAQLIDPRLVRILLDQPNDLLKDLPPLPHPGPSTIRVDRGVGLELPASPCKLNDKSADVACVLQAHNEVGQKSEVI